MRTPVLMLPISAYVLICAIDSPVPASRLDNCNSVRIPKQTLEWTARPVINQESGRSRYFPFCKGSELLGVFEVLSTRPNAFGHNELYGLQDLCGRILPVRQQYSEITVKMPSELAAKIKEATPPDKSHIPGDLHNESENERTTPS